MIGFTLLLSGGLPARSFSVMELVRIPPVKSLPAPHPLGISGDGRTVFGQFSPGNSFVFRSGSLRRFRPAPEARALDQYVTGVSFDGSVIVGSAGGAFVWNRGSVSYPSSARSFAVGVSSDGQSLAYYVDNNGGYQSVLKRGSTKSSVDGLAPVAVSGDGTTLVGNLTIEGNLVAHTFKNGSLTKLSLDSTFVDSIASGVDAKGSVVVGSAVNRFGTAACVWKDGVFAKLPCGSALTSLAKCVSSDGKVIGGFTGTEAAIWDDTRTRITVDDLLGNPSGWKFESVNGISKVGNVITITGWGHFRTKEAGYVAKVRMK
ncbi:MAG TPA: hypothetical protein VK171_04880 [Fimbriimonas sp.]|nr:hypothetical protein [Fimbriimonas sp.]